LAPRPPLVREPVLTTTAPAFDPDSPAAVPPRPPDTIELAFRPGHDLPRALAATRRLATGHYENFSVVSALVPRKLRQDFCNIYAFCRIADDLGDEMGDRNASLRALDRFRRQTERMYTGDVDTVVFTALNSTVQAHAIPAKPFLDLLDAFEQDQRVDRYQTGDQLLDYCRRSADPVGRLVLYLCGHGDEPRQRLSDFTCTALQLVNFWQDVRRDLVDRNRIYLPRETMDRFGVTESQLKAGQCDDHYRGAIRFEIDRVDALFEQGEPLLPMLDPSIRPQVSLFAAGGRAISRAIRRQDFDTLSHRPSLSKWQKGKLVVRALLGRLSQGTGAGAA
jgi:squalene synthase HpnC